MRSDFERAAAPMILLHRNGWRERNDLQQTSQILGALMMQIPVQPKGAATRDGKASIGKTGVHL